MNIVLFEESELGRPLPEDDPRAVHICRVLKRGVGEPFDAGIVDGAIGKATLVATGPGGLTLAFSWATSPAPLDPITLVVALPRPQTARKILQEAATLGVQALVFFGAERSEPSYGQSRLWSDGEWRRHLVDGAAQAFSTRLPAVRHAASLAEAVEAVRPPARVIALDNYEAEGAASALLGRMPPPFVLALGPERGWSAAERTLLRDRGAALAHLGSRVLRSETALCAAVTLAKVSLGTM